MLKEYDDDEAVWIYEKPWNLKLSVKLHKLKLLQAEIQLEFYRRWIRNTEKVVGARKKASQLLNWKIGVFALRKFIGIKRTALAYRDLKIKFPFLD